MSTWEHRGFELKVRQRIQQEFCMANGFSGLQIAEKICAQNPKVTEAEALAAIDAWAQAAWDETEGTAAYGRKHDRLEHERNSDPQRA